MVASPPITSVRATTSALRRTLARYLVTRERKAGASSPGQRQMRWVRSSCGRYDPSACAAPCGASMTKTSVSADMLAPVCKQEACLCITPFNMREYVAAVGEIPAFSAQ